jgi:hypothetical protein
MAITIITKRGVDFHTRHRNKRQVGEIVSPLRGSPVFLE